MIDVTVIAIFIGLNALLYLIIHLPLDILTFRTKDEKYKEEAKEYPPWDKKNTIKIITVVASILFWIFFIGWPILHLLSWDNFILFFNFQIPIVGTYIQIVGMILVSLGTLIAIIGRYSRGKTAISWGVPKKLTIRGGFRIVRHPLYASYCYFFLGLPLVVSNYLLLPLILGIIGYYYSALYEEKILVEEFGNEYRAYQEKVGMLVPFFGRKKYVHKK